MDLHVPAALRKLLASIVDTHGWHALLTHLAAAYPHLDLYQVSTDWLDGPPVEGQGHPRRPPHPLRRLGARTVNDTISPADKTLIDNMSHYQLAATWRFASSSSPLVQGATGAYLKERLDVLGGITPELSKSLSR